MIGRQIRQMSVKHFYLSSFLFTSHHLYSYIQLNYNFIINYTVCHYCQCLNTNLYKSSLPRSLGKPVIEDVGVLIIIRRMCTDCLPPDVISSSPPLDNERSVPLMVTMITECTSATLLVMADIFIFKVVLPKSDKSN